MDENTVKIEVKDKKIVGVKIDPYPTEDGWVEVSEYPDDFIDNPYEWGYADGQFFYDTEKVEEEERTSEIYRRIAEAQQNLDSTDYIIIKIAEGVATAEEYADIILQRAEWRKEINRLRGQL